METPIQIKHEETSDIEDLEMLEEEDPGSGHMKQEIDEETAGESRQSDAEWQWGDNSDTDDSELRETKLEYYEETDHESRDGCNENNNTDNTYQQEVGDDEATTPRNNESACRESFSPGENAFSPGENAFSSGKNDSGRAEESLVPQEELEIECAMEVVSECTVRTEGQHDQIPKLKIKRNKKINTGKSRKKSKNSAELENTEKSGKKAGEHAKNECPDCSYSSNSKSNFSKHRKDMHGVTVVRLRLDKGEKHECSECTYSSPSRSNFRRHCINKHGIDPGRLRERKRKKKETAEESGKHKLKPRLKSLLTKPLQKQVKQWKKNRELLMRGGDSVKCCMCEECGKVCEDVNRLKRHKARHYREKHPVVCKVCGTKLFSKSTLNNHMRTHTGEKPFSCEVCGQQFSSKANAKRHMISHTGEKRYNCAVCGKFFAYATTFSRHMKAHAGKKPHVCVVCGKRYVAPHELRSHERTHTGERPFPCEYCNRSFKTSVHMTRHRRTHTGEKPYKCEICNERFTWNVSRKNHIKRVHEEGREPAPPRQYKRRLPKPEPEPKSEQSQEESTEPKASPLNTEIKKTPPKQTKGRRAFNQQKFQDEDIRELAEAFVPEYNLAIQHTTQISQHSNQRIVFT